MSHPLDEKIEQANNRLRGVSRVTILRRENRLYLRGTLPPKPHIDRSKPYQQAISIGSRAIANEQGLKFAVQQAQILTGQLIAGTFNWADWLDLEKVCPTATGLVRHWIAEFEQDYWTRVKRTPEREFNWRADYGNTFSRIPQDEELTIDLLEEVIRSTPPDSKTRLRTTTYCCILAQFAKLEGVDRLRSLKGSYSGKKVDPRTLPTDQEIQEWCDSITSHRWRWVAGMMAAYGLRNHEAFHAEMDDYPRAIVTKGKTGSRIVIPLYPEWAERWNLWEKSLPNVNLSMPNAKLGQRVTGWFHDTSAPFTPYCLRHCYARRCFEFNIAPDRASRLMGHSLSIHLQIYRMWFDSEVYIKDFEKILSRSDRPMPPS